MGGRGKKSGSQSQATNQGSGDSVTSTQMDMLRYSKYGEKMTLANAEDYAAGAKSGLTRDETDLIYSYTNDMYTDLNEDLRGGSPGVTQFMKDKINVALEKLPAHKGTTYRSIQIDNPKQFVSSLSGSKDFKFDDFVSTTTDRSQLSNFSGNIQFEIQSKRGRTVSHISAQKSEKEVLFKAGSRFKFLSSTNNNGKTIIKIAEL